ncbi:zinc finger, CCHC-type containing protein [Tanacetum coccineum]
MFSIVTEPIYGIIYKNNKKEKRVMGHQEIHKFCDATLKRVLEGLKSYNNDVKHGYVTPSISKEDVEYLRLFEEEIEERLKHHDQMRRWEMAVVRLTDPKRKTLSEKGIDCIFVGYAEHSKAYRFYVIKPNDSVSINSIIESRDAIFNENRFSSILRPKDIIPNSDESQRVDYSNDVPSDILESHRGKRARKAKSYGSDFQLYLVEGSRDRVGSQYSYCYSIEEDPRTYNEAMLSRDSAFWKEAIDDEIGSIMENNTWVLSDLPPGCKLLGCKWIFKRKMKVDGTIDEFKARLVIQDFRQKEGIDYFDTYAPVALITTIRLLLALAAIHNLVIHQMDVKTTFLNGDLEEEVYMKQPKGFVMPGNEHKMCAMTSTRPDIAYAVGKLSRFTSNPSRHHWKAITRVFKYLRDSSSTSGRVFLLGGGAISWASKKKTCITGSTMKSEFVALTVIGSNIWLENLFMLKL